MSSFVKRGNVVCNQATRSSSVVTFWGVNDGPSLALLPTRAFRPFTFLRRSCRLGRSWMKTPSVLVQFGQ
jgi:hypothetical protein